MTMNMNGGWRAIIKRNAFLNWRLVFSSQYISFSLFLSPSIFIFISAILCFAAGAINTDSDRRNTTLTGERLCFILPKHSRNIVVFHSLPLFLFILDYYTELISLSLSLSPSPILSHFLEESFFVSLFPLRWCERECATILFRIFILKGHHQSEASWRNWPN